MKTKPIIGQVLYSLNVGNAARHGVERITPVTVIKVGKKHFSCDNNLEYIIDTWCQKTSYTAVSVLYDSIDAYESEKEYEKISDAIVSFFRNYNRTDLSLIKLREIDKIIKEQL